MSKREEIIALRETGASYDRISVELSVDKSYAWRVCNKKSAGRKMLSSEIHPSLNEHEEKLNSLESGVVTETLVFAKLISLGFDVWKPFIDRHRCDAAIYGNGKLIRLQIKAAGYDQKSKRFRALLATKNQHGAKKYLDNEFEFFIIKCVGIDEIYIVPSTIGNKVGYANLYPHREKLMDSGNDFESFRNNWTLLKNATA